MAAKPEFHFIRACSTGKFEVVRQLLENGLSPETRDRYGLTGLIWAARKGRIEAAKILLDFGADANATDRRSRTALHHSVGYKRRDFVTFIIGRGAALNHTDFHGCTALDLAAYAADGKTIALLESHGAQRVKTLENPLLRTPGKNSFCLPAVMGGGEPDFVSREHQQLRRLSRQWIGEYCSEIKLFSFFLLVDGDLIRHSESENRRGVQKARRSRDELHVKIYVPEDWWKPGPSAYKRHLADAIEEGLLSMIALMQRNKYRINSELLLNDWAKLKNAFLAS